MTQASITKDITLVGQANYIEVWDTQKYDTYLTTSDDFDSVFFQSVEAGFAKK
jgi:DNA-binding transcriptional regulator/RsmH inhibitor MraZ